MKTRIVFCFGIVIAVGSLTPPSAQALTTFASYSAIPGDVSNVSWTRTGFDAGTLANIPADSDLEAGVTDMAFSFLGFGLPTNLAADFSLNASSTSAAVIAFGVLIAQPGISGSFSYTYDGPSTLIGGVSFTHGANLLSGTFNNGFINGIAGSGTGSAQAEIITTGPLVFTSDFLTFQTPNPGDEALSISLNSIAPPLQIFGPGDTIANFNSSTAGNFSADVVTSVPEPASGSIMLMAFASMGMVIHRQRRAKVGACERVGPRH